MNYCDRCDRYFGSMRALDMHEQNSSNHNICCGTDFPTRDHMEQHWIQSPQHTYCQRCDEHFDDSDDLDYHYNNSHHFCNSCRKIFVNEHGLKEHYRQSERHHYCFPCNTHFVNDHNLRQHLNSGIHRPKNTHCPFGCGSSFISNSALVLHLEAGACSSGVNRNAVNRYVRQLDTNHVITDPSRLITGGSSGNEEIEYYATDASWNGSGFECYLCHNVYSTLKGLNQHLASPRHQDKIYICPGVNCRIHFSALSALCQHIESGRCDVLKFRAVQATMDRYLGQMNRLTYN